MTYLISFAQSFIHYHSVAMKLGVNLSKEEESGRFVFVDCLTRLIDENDTLKNDGTSSSNSRPAFSLGRFDNRLFISPLVVRLCILLPP